MFQQITKKRIDQHQNQWRWDPINQDKNTRSTLIPIFLFFFQTTLHQLHSLLLFLLLLLLLLIAIPNNNLTYFSSKPSTSFSSSLFTNILFTSFPRSTCWPFLGFFSLSTCQVLPTYTHLSSIFFLLSKVKTFNLHTHKIYIIFTSETIYIYNNNNNKITNHMQFSKNKLNRWINK